MLEKSYELGPVRPPSEAYSLLIRVTRNCPWNRCRFCSIYKGQRFELRTAEEVMRDITTAAEIAADIKVMARRGGNGDNLAEAAAAVVNSPPNDSYRNVALWLYAGGRNAFLQDANTIIMRTPELAEVIRFMKSTFPSIDRITSYGRSKTALKKSLEELVELQEAGLTRLHIGLESGDDAVLAHMEKGVTAAEHIEAGKKVVASGISLSEYVLLGLGGKDGYRQNAVETARVLSAIKPDYIRIRTLSVNERIPLNDDIGCGLFSKPTDDEMVDELKVFIENMTGRANLVSDHIGNLLQEVEGKLPEDKDSLLAVIGRYQAMDEPARLHFRIGRRLGVYTGLDDMDNPRRRQAVEGIITRFKENGRTLDDNLIGEMMKNYSA